MTRGGMSKADVVRVGQHLRRVLGSSRVWLDQPTTRGQTVQLRVGETPIGTCDLDEDGDFVVTLPVFRDELPP